MLTFSLPKESWCLVDLRCLVSGRSGLQFVAINEIKVDLVGMINVWSIFKVVSDNLTLKWFVNKENIIYLLECAICGLQYIGETKQQLSKRLNDHRSDENCKPDLPLSRYLRSTGHHDSFGKLKAP
jgi:hypothetical protein